MMVIDDMECLLLMLTDDKFLGQFLLKVSFQIIELAPMPQNRLQTAVILDLLTRVEYDWGVLFFFFSKNALRLFFILT